MEPNDAEEASDSDLDVLFFEQDCLVINKPGGILTQAPAGIVSIEALVRQIFRNTTSDASNVYVGMPHRLDRPASGVMLFGQSKPVTRKLATQFEKRTIKKTYWVIVEGIVANAEGAWSDWMRKLPEQPQSEIVEASHPDAQNALLEYKVVQRSDRFSFLQIALETGRTHQIRLQAASRGFPVVGDHQYGAVATFGPQTDDQRKRWIGLHAREIDFWHPRLHRPTIVTAPLSQYWRNADFGFDFTQIESNE